MDVDPKPPVATEKEVDNEDDEEDDEDEEDVLVLRSSCLMGRTS
jgi:hypothetical protein